MIRTGASQLAQKLAPATLDGRELKLRPILMASLGLVGAGALLTLGIVVALRKVPHFYAEALAQDVSVQLAASQEMGSRATALYNQVKNQGDWNALFTAKQINGWLAVDAVEQYPQMESGGIRDPRVAFQPERMTIGFRVDRGGLSTVFSVDAEVYLSEPNVVACRILKARAGALRLPLKRVLDEVTRAAKILEIPLRWAQSDGDPVALIPVFLGHDDDNNEIHLDHLELLDGEIYFSGCTEQADPKAGARRTTAFQPAHHALRKINDHR